MTLRAPLTAAALGAALVVWACGSTPGDTDSLGEPGGVPSPGDGRGDTSPDEPGVLSPGQEDRAEPEVPLVVTTGSWNETVYLSASLGGWPGRPQICFDAGGRGLGVWHHRDAALGFFDDGATEGLAFAAYSPEMGWSAAAPLPGAGGSNFHLGVDDAGRATAVWEVYDYQLYVRHIMASHLGARGWTEPESLVSMPQSEGSIDAPQLAVGAGGTVLLAWRSRVGPIDSVYARAYHPSSGWEPAVLLTSGTLASAAGPLVRASVNGSGAGIVVWGTSDDGVLELRLRRYQGDGWEEVDEVVGDLGTSTYLSRFDARHDDSGRTHLFWIGPDPELEWPQQAVGGVSSPYPGAWGHPARITTISDYGFSGVLAAYASAQSGRAIFVWREGDGETARVRAMHFDPESGFGAPSIVADGLQPPYMGCAEMDVYYLDASIDAEGRALVTWEERRGGWQLAIWGAQYSPGGGWRAVTEITTDAESGSQPRVAAAPGGDGVAMFISARESGTDVASTRFVAESAR